MSAPLRVALLWHMHQPYYLDDLSGETSLPWVRLHATKAYADMNAVLARHPQMACTINVVPSLLAQLKAYEQDERLSDTFLNLSRIYPEDLEPDEKAFIVRYFFMSNWDTMVRRHPGYAALLQRRGVPGDPAAVDKAVHRFSRQDLRDLQVWFNLSWFGFNAQRDERIAPLLAKGGSFTEAEKSLVLDVQAEVLAGVIPGWKRLLDAGRVEISTSPFYHPILPILVGSDVVRRSMPYVMLPGDFSFRDDARAQIQRGVDYYRETFGRAPVGVWPSEGSVCPEVVPLFAEAGLKWMATDEGILARSLPEFSRERDLYRPYRMAVNEAEVSVFFRDRYLSDLIGFTYSKNPPEIALADFVRHLDRIRQVTPGGTVSIVLDGENPWEYYADGGEGFLNGLFRILVEDERFEPVSMRQAVEEQPPQRTLNKLHSGSWINANYGIWIGGPEENQAWTLVQRTHNALKMARQAGRHDPAALDAAEEQLFQAEGSDWFWWYDDDFNSENDAEFDNLFRGKLKNVFRLLGDRVPAYLDEPIHRERDSQLVVQPLSLISPQLDGRVTHFYEWKDAGFIDLAKVRGSMHLSKNILHKLYFGFDQQNLYLRLDPSDECLAYGENGLRVVIQLQGQVERQVSFPFALGDAELREYELLAPDDLSRWETVAQHDGVRVGEIAEVAVPFKLLDVSPGQPLWFVIYLMKGEVEEDRFPKNGRVMIYVPDENYDSINWSV
ncbi:MAG TPA: glycoside hydrolase family 57 protein [bacterium]|nr:glycoside hydrolase family 57 protein [bacterium]